MPSTRPNPLLAKSQFSHRGPSRTKGTRVFLLLACSMTGSHLGAHPGGVDARGGHTDSVTGIYHYHYPASAAAPAAEKPTAVPAAAALAELEKLLKQQAAEIAALKARIEQLEAKVKSLEPPSPPPKTGKAPGRVPSWLSSFLVVSPLFQPSHARDPRSPQLLRQSRSSRLLRTDARQDPPAR